MAPVEMRKTVPLIEAVRNVALRKILKSRIGARVDFGVAGRKARRR